MTSPVALVSEATCWHQGNIRGHLWAVGWQLCGHWAALQLEHVGWDLTLPLSQAELGSPEIQVPHP